jgi:hypothetical protein
MMNVALWIVAGLLGTLYLAGGVRKLVVPREKLASAVGGNWVEDFSVDAIRAFGVLEILAAVGLVLPAIIDVAPVLVPLAALGLVAYMGGAVVLRIRLHEVPAMAGDLVFLALAAFVAWGRFGDWAFA